jgi:hypothetical protein
VSWILRFRNDVRGWVVILKANGMTRTLFQLMRNSVLSRQPRDIRSPEVAEMFDEAERIWDSVDDDGP